MAGTRVVDASALAALVYGEPEGPAIGKRLEGATLVAPDLIILEMANVCLVKSRRDPPKADAYRAAFDLFLSMDIELVAVAGAETLDLALARGLTAYDAAYLWLAQDRGVELVTLDRQLLKASGH